MPGFSIEPPAMMIFVPIMLQAGFSRGRLREKTLRKVELLVLNIRLLLSMAESVV